MLCVRALATTRPYWRWPPVCGTFPYTTPWVQEPHFHSAWRILSLPELWSGYACLLASFADGHLVPKWQFCLCTNLLLLLTWALEVTLNLVDCWICLGCWQLLSSVPCRSSAGLHLSQWGHCLLWGNPWLVPSCGVTLFVLLSDTLNVHLRVCEMLTTLSTLDFVFYFRIICMWK